ncbi:MAG TPA: chemotaxis protein CheA, partial [Acidobacteriota bacterium]|nr:chemotaxis protein CheA [Acidobacteriota bacterium]
MFEDPEIVLEFLTESNENLARLDQEMVELEQHPGDKNLLASVFRTIHTIKGTCGFLGFSRLESLAHAGESLLSQLRDGQLALTPERTSGLLSMVDAIRQTLTCIEVEKNEGTTDYTPIIERLTRLREPAGDTPPPAGLPEIKAVPLPPPSPALPDLSLKPAVRPPADEYDPQPGHLNLFEINTVAGVFGGDLASAQPVVDGRTSVADTNIRVDVGLLDKLMNLVGELVLARNQILQFTATQEDTAFIATSQRLNLITTELQEGVMKTRMQPIGNIWSKFPRIVRDLALACGKRVQIDMEGKETELDRTIIEAIKDPLTHIVRNSIDHGIELPEVRESRGKSPEGRLFLRAFHEGGQVNIEISDDGAGIDPERIKARAIQRGMFPPEQANRLTDRELINLIFAPGFSTAEKVTNVSGRGAGMDVVKTNI